MSSIQGLLCEVRPNLEIIQVIKAADQLYYKDKTLYTDIKPEFTACNEGKGSQQKGAGNVASKQQEQDQPDKRTTGLSESSTGEALRDQQKSQKQSKKDKKKANKGGNQGKKEAQQQQASPTSQTGAESSPGSKLQQVIEQAKKTVENALTAGGGGQSSSAEEAKCEAEMYKKLAQRVDKLERITKKLLEHTGLTEADLLD